MPPLAPAPVTPDPSQPVSPLDPAHGITGTPAPEGSRIGYLMIVIIILAAIFGSAHFACAQTVYQRSPELQAALEQAQATPCGGIIAPVVLGMSIYERYQKDMELRYRYTTYAGVKAANVRWIGNAISGHDAKQWADPNNTGWTALATKLARIGASPCAVPWVLIGLTNASPHKYGLMTEAQIDAILTNLLTKGYRPQWVTLATINETFCESPCLAPWWAVEADHELLASYAGVRSYLVNGQTVTLAVDYLPVRYGVPWYPSDLEADMTHPNLTSGTPKGGGYIMESIMGDPLFAWLRR